MRKTEQKQYYTTGLGSRKTAAEKEISEYPSLLKMSGILPEHLKRKTKQSRRPSLAEGADPEPKKR